MGGWGQSSPGGRGLGARSSPGGEGVSGAASQFAGRTVGAAPWDARGFWVQCRGQCVAAHFMQLGLFQIGQLGKVASTALSQLTSTGVRFRSAV